MFTGFEGLVMIATAVATATSFGLSADSMPPHMISNPTATIQKVYKENGRIVSDPTMNYADATAACPKGHQTVRQETRQDGNREYLVWTIRCRNEASVYATYGR